MQHLPSLQERACAPAQITWLPVLASLSSSVLGQRDRLGSSVSSASLLRAFFNAFPVSSLSLASGLVLSLSLSKWQAAKQAHNLSLGCHQGMQLWSAKSITEASSPAPSVMAPCGISSAAPSLYPLEVTICKNACFTLSKSKNRAYPVLSYTGTYTDIYTMALLHPVPFLASFWASGAWKQRSKRILRCFMCLWERDCLNQWLCSVQSQLTGTRLQPSLLWSSLEKPEFSFRLADKVGIVKKPEIQVLLKSYAVPQARRGTQASPSKLQWNNQVFLEQPRVAKSCLLRYMKSVPLRVTMRDWAQLEQGNTNPSG